MTNIHERHNYSMRISSVPERPKPKVYEDYGYVLDYLPYGRSSQEMHRGPLTPIVQLIGESYYTLLDAQLKPSTTVLIEERVYIGRSEREKILRVLGRISYRELTTTAKTELETVLETIIRNQEPKFIDFFNKSSAITPRMHSLELLSGIGKKSMWNIIRERERASFTSFQDISERTGITAPTKLLASRIVQELSEESKYRLFTRYA